MCRQWNPTQGERVSRYALIINRAARPGKIRRPAAHPELILLTLELDVSVFMETLETSGSLCSGTIADNKHDQRMHVVELH